MHDVTLKRFPKHACRLEPVIFPKDDLQALKCVQSPGARLAMTSTHCGRHAAVRPLWFARDPQQKLNSVLVQQVMVDKAP